MVKVKLLGVATSARHGNTEIAVNWALESARELPGVETEFVSLSGKVIRSCLDCTGRGGHLCTGAPKDNPCPRIPDDDFREICLKMVQPDIDGYIMGATVDFQQAGAAWHCLKSRLVCLEHNQWGPEALRCRVFGAIAIGAVPYGGQSTALEQMVIWAHQTDMYVVGCGPEPGAACGGYIGASGATCRSAATGRIFRNREPLKLGSREEKQAILEDKACLKQCQNLGKRVAETAKVIKNGYSTLSPEELRWPKGPIPTGGYEFAHE
ncbi:MAG: flavodoxin family protein [Chloroflexi bacterium]|nr:flavodoxin family protein [Chloroflexota bacterium]